MNEVAGRCRECGGAGQRMYSDLCDRHFGVSGRWCIWYCSECDRWWLEPRPTADEIRASYDDYYTHGDSTAVGFEAWLKRAIPGVCLGYSDRVTVPTRVFGTLVSTLGPLRTIGERSTFWLRGEDRGRLLDVGCGSGEAMLRMRELGWEVAGVEFDTEAARIASERTGAPVLSSLGEAEVGGFDAVTLDHVVEHLADAPAMLRDCARALRPGGRLALATPNAGSAARESFGADWLHWDPPRHLELRGAKGLEKLVSGSGFEVESVFSCAGSAHFVWNASRVIQRDGSLPGISVGKLSLMERFSGIRFWLAEHSRVARGESCGEEWIVLARRSG